MWYFKRLFKNSFKINPLCNVSNTHHSVPGKAQLLVYEHCKVNLIFNIILSFRHQSSVKYI